MHPGGITGRRGLRGNNSLGGTPARSHLYANQKRSLACGFLPRNGGPEGHTSAGAHIVARFLAARTSQAENAYPSVPEALAADTDVAAVATDFSGCATWATCVDATLPITTVEMACLKMSCS